MLCVILSNTQCDFATGWTIPLLGTGVLRPRSGTRRPPAVRISVGDLAQGGRGQSVC